MKGPGLKKAPGIHSAEAMPLVLTSTVALPTKKPNIPWCPAPKLPILTLKGLEHIVYSPSRGQRVGADVSVSLL